jgi:ubiquitin-like protein Pup
MAERIHKQRPTRTGDHTSGEQDNVDVAAETASATSRLKEELDDLLDEIDNVLESNAEDFVKSYVQKGGQ